METIRIDKLWAASRQLDAAIRMLFAEEDLVAVHTIVGAASAILSKLIEIRAPEKSWDRVSQNASGLDSNTYSNIIRKTEIFLKHADHDPDSVHEFSAADTPGILMWAIMNLAELQKLTQTQQVFQLWFLACNLDLIDSEAEIARIVRHEFKDLSRRSMSYRLAVGRRALEEHAPRERLTYVNVQT
jgi:hypothetical protein